jgi:hypothetical protein
LRDTNGYFNAIFRLAKSKLQHGHAGRENASFKASTSA